MLQLDKKHQKHQKYNPTDIDWIRDIPDGWKLKPLKSIFRLKKNIVGEDCNMYDILSLTVKGVIPRDMESNFGKFPAEYNAYQIVKPNDLIFCLFDYDVTPRTIGHSEYLGLVTGAYTTVMPIGEIHSKYYYYYYLNLDNSKELLHLCTGLRNGLDKDMFFSLKNPVPPIEEQKKITYYLDEKTSILDEAVAKKKKQIELLAEHRTALINDAITKGLNPNAEMKDSGVEWIGKIPVHWEVKPLYSEVRENKKRNEGNTNNNVLSLSYGKIIRRDVENNFGLLPESFETYQVVDEGMVIMRLTDLQNDKKSLRVGYVKELGIITSAYVGLISKGGIISSFLYQLLHSYDLQKVFYFLGGGVRQGMNYEDLRRLPLLIPPIEEQKEITDYLNKETKYIDDMIAKIEKSIELLEEYKTSLIAHMVSGKIRVS